MRRFKEHQVDGITIEEKLSSAMAINFKFNSYRSYFNLYLKNLKKALISFEYYDKDSTMASMMMLYTLHSKAQ